MPIDNIQEDRRGLFRGDGGGGWSNMDHLAEPVDEDKDSSTALHITGKTENEVHADGRPRRSSHFE
ncbi:hypothetical protein L917_09897 [Phytophthora nicotianae]|uniref:Uncharacterized protein n=2 Tax=Phytophthora nicotianae TaxID=4792 RepID=W2R860_PHYN3|nr:hypothetical protein PPTG_01737 [Phytophthora nicotianae INRA-310]ETL91565.1 hypothetical protein L917_09897 [Phytophthora nicotianae]ETN21593.1 hypothetical protein PPTG_01737 [Phytophthora nicotianae INRA-310]